MEKSPSAESYSLSASQEIRPILGTHSVTTTFTKTRHLFLSQAKLIHFNSPSYFLKVHFLSFHLRLDFPSCLSPSDFPTHILYIHLLFTVRATCPAHLILLNLTTRIIQGVPLVTEPGISLIILTPMKILQRNLNRSTFVVWEMKKNMSVVCVCSVSL